MKIVTIGARPTYLSFLQKLATGPHQIVGTYVSEYCFAAEGPLVQKLGLPLRSEKIGSDEFVSSLKLLQPDLIVVYGALEILRRNVIEIPRLGVINLHAALLPLQLSSPGCARADVGEIESH